MKTIYSLYGVKFEFCDGLRDAVTKFIMNDLHQSKGGPA